MHKSKEPIEIRRVESEKELMEFVMLPWKLYRDDPLWAPPLIKQQKHFLGPDNPFFQHAEAECYLASRGGETCGRISMSVDPDYNEFKNEKMGTFGFFETSNDFEVASRLIDTARDTLTRKGMEIMRGPFNFSIKHEWGMLVDGFDKRPMIRTCHNPPYYVKLVEEYGLSKAHDWHSYLVRVDHQDLDLSYVRKLTEKAARNGVVVRKVNLKDAQGEMERVREIINNAHSNDWGFSPLSDAESREMAASMKEFVIEDLAYFGEIDGKAIGFLMFIPDYNMVLKKMNGKMGPVQMLQFLWHKNRIKTGRFLLAGVFEEHHRTGVAAAMGIKLYESAVRRGIKVGELSRILETNTASRTIAEMAGGKIYKTHRIYEMSLSA